MRRLFVPLLVCTFLAAGCSKKEEAAQPAPSAATGPAPAPAKVAVPDFEYEPLTQANVDFYKSVMTEAAAKRKAITDPADLKALEFDEQSFAQSRKEKVIKYHKYTDQENAWFDRADNLHHLDDDVAKAKGQWELYNELRAAIEGMIGPRMCTDRDCGKGMPEDDPKMRKQQVEEDKKRRAIIEQDMTLLKPQEKEINDLILQVRDY